MTTPSGISALRMMTTMPSWIMKPPAGRQQGGAQCMRVSHSNQPAMQSSQAAA